MTAVAKLPELPEPVTRAIDCGAFNVEVSGYTDEQMRSYARDAIAALSPAELGGVVLSDVERKALAGLMANVEYEAGDVEDAAPSTEADEDAYWAWHQYHALRKLSTPRAAEAVVDDAIRDLAELEPADADHPDTLCVKHSDLLRILVRHFAALTPPSAKGE